MILVVLTIFISLILDGILSNIIPMNTNFLIPLFSLVAVILIYPFFKKNNNNYLIATSIIGFIYDIVYTDTIGLNLIIFLAMGILTKYFYSILNINIINCLINLFLLIIFYRITTFIILYLSGYLNWSFSLLFKSIYSSIILNIGYCLISYYVLDWLSYKFKIKKMIN